MHVLVLQLVPHSAKIFNRRRYPKPNPRIVREKLECRLSCRTGVRDSRYPKSQLGYMQCNAQCLGISISLVSQPLFALENRIRGGWFARLDCNEVNWMMMVHLKWWCRLRVMGLSYAFRAFAMISF